MTLSLNLKLTINWHGNRELKLRRFIDSIPLLISNCFDKNFLGRKRETIRKKKSSSYSVAVIRREKESERERFLLSGELLLQIRLFFVAPSCKACVAAVVLFFLLRPWTTRFGFNKHFVVSIGPAFLTVFFFPVLTNTAMDNSEFTGKWIRWYIICLNVWARLSIFVLEIFAFCLLIEMLMEVSVKS